MAKYKCSICGYIYDEDEKGKLFNDLEDNFKCPLCSVSKDLFILDDNTSFLDDFDDINTNSVVVSKDNVAIAKDKLKCINCGMCKITCSEKCGLSFDKNSEVCINCGQCILTCPTGALRVKSAKEKLFDMLNSDKICICYTSPSIRVSFAEGFGKDYGTFSQEKLVGALRDLGFKYVLDVTFGADLTIMEEASELINRINNNGVLPMFTSCCPAWVKYCETFYPELIPNISTCKSPIGMQGAIVNEYFTKKMGIDKNDIFTVAITPCTAKKYEITKDDVYGTDLVVTISELIDILKEKNINYEDIKISNFDSLLGEGSGAGLIFGNTGGVMEAALRTAYYFVTDKELENDMIEFNEVRGLNNVKEAKIKLGKNTLNVAIVHKISETKKILEDVKNGVSKYHFIEIMNCEGGCVGGGGQPKDLGMSDKEKLNKRIESIYNKDKENIIRCSHNNPDIKLVYEEYLGKPLSRVSKEILHTSYSDKSYLIDKSIQDIK